MPFERYRNRMKYAKADEKVATVFKLAYEQSKGSIKIGMLKLDEFSEAMGHQAQAEKLEWVSV